jgi:hypothetical protein
MKRFSMNDTPAATIDRYELAEELCAFGDNVRVPREHRETLMGIIGRLMGTTIPLTEIARRLLALAQLCQNDELFRFTHRIEALAVYGAQGHVIDIEQGANHEITGAEWITAARRIGNSVRSSIAYSALTGAEVGRAVVETTWKVTVTTGNSTLRFAVPAGADRA